MDKKEVTLLPAVQGAGLFNDHMAGYAEAAVVRCQAPDIALSGFDGFDIAVFGTMGTVLFVPP